jgi:hypothetical protein
MKVCIELDDFGKDNHRLDLLMKLKEHFPNFKVTMFAIPAQCPDDWVAKLPDWIELAFHGDTHAYRECEKWTHQEAFSFHFKYANKPRFVNIFRPPYWLLSDQAHEYLNMYFFLCLHPDDKRANNYTYNWNLKDDYVDASFANSDADVLCGHGHVQNVCGNGLEESFNRIMQLPKDTDFYFVSEVINLTRSQALVEERKEG